MTRRPPSGLRLHEPVVGSTKTWREVHVMWFASSLKRRLFVPEVALAQLCATYKGEVGPMTYYLCCLFSETFNESSSLLHLFKIQAFLRNPLVVIIFSEAIYNRLPIFYLAESFRVTWLLRRLPERDLRFDPVEPKEHSCGRPTKIKSRALAGDVRVLCFIQCEYIFSIYLKGTFSMKCAEKFILGTVIY